MEHLRRQRRGAKKIPPDHLYSSTLIRGIVKNQNPKHVCGRPVIIKNRANGGPQQARRTKARSGTSPPAQRPKATVPGSSACPVLTRQGPSALGGAIDYVVRGKMIGGFALVAYPAEYGNSGVMTFVVNHQDVVFQKDLGLSTARVAGAMTTFNTDQSWSHVVI